MPRPKVSVYIATSVDGYIAREDGGLDFLERASGSGGDYGYAEFAATVDALVIGRATYDTVLGFASTEAAEWPFAGKRVVVLTHHALEPRHGEERHEGALAPLLERLGAEGVRHVYLDGGVAVREGLAEGVVDALTISIVPVVLGSGRPLFRAGLPELSLRLVSAQPYSTGLVQVRYERA